MYKMSQKQNMTKQKLSFFNEYVHIIYVNYTKQEVHV